MTKKLITKSLDPETSPFLEDLLTNAQVVVCDVDYTLLDVGRGHKAGIDKIAELFDRKLADEVDAMFNLVLEGHRKASEEDWKQRDAFNEAIKRMEELQSGIVKEYSLKVWSVETWILIVAEKYGRRLTGKDVEAGRDAYWNGRRGGSKVYKDARPFVAKLQELDKPLFLMTSGYSILRVGKDCSLQYDPDYSEKYKRDALADLPFSYIGMVIGDPIDKPDPRFFDKLFQEVDRKTAVSFQTDRMKEILVIGDSERNDLHVPRQRGCTTLLIKRG